MKEKLGLPQLRKSIVVVAVCVFALFALISAPPRQRYSPFPALLTATSVQAKVGAREKITFASEGAIYVVNSDGTGLRELIPAASPTVNLTPSWSPDVSQIAFASNRDSHYPHNFDIYVMQADGSNVRRLTDSPIYESEPAWSPDGSQIAFVRGYDPTTGPVINLFGCADPKIFVINADGSEAFNPINGTRGTDPAWSPDGDRIVFSYNDDGQYGIRVIDLTTGEITRLTNHLAQEGEPAWSPDGKHIAFARNFAVEHSECGIMVGGFEPPSYAGPDVYVVNADGSNETRLTSTEASGEPAWSADGARIAFTVFAPNSDSRIYATDAQFGGGEEWQLLSGPLGSATSPAWQRLLDGQVAVKSVAAEN
jgi:Tol biopolymer transport system component